MARTYLHLYKYFDQILHVETFYTTWDSGRDRHVAHDFRFMCQRQFGRSVAFLLGFSSVAVRYVSRVLWRVLFSGDHHTFLDMLLLQKQYPQTYKMVADKDEQFEFLEQRARVSRPPRPVRLVPRFDRAGIRSGLLRLAGESAKNPQDPEMGEVPACDDELVFVKPRWGAFGEHCEALGIRDIRSKFTPKQYDAFVFEKRLRNAAYISEFFNGDAQCLITVRIWTKSYAGQTTSMGALLVSDHPWISNSKENRAFPICDQTGIVQFASKHSGPCRRRRRCQFTTIGTELKIKEWQSMKEIAEWAHTQFDRLPFVGWDFAATDDGVILIEGNAMCSYSKYLGDVGHFYTVDEVEKFFERREVKQAWPELPPAKGEMDKGDLWIAS